MYFSLYDQLNLIYIKEEQSLSSGESNIISKYDDSAYHTVNGRELVDIYKTKERF